MLVKEICECGMGSEREREWRTLWTGLKMMKKKKWDVGLFNLLQFIGASKSMKSEWKNNRKSLIRFALFTIFFSFFCCYFQTFFFRWITYWTGNWLIYCTLNTTQLSIFSPIQFSLGKSNKKILYSAKLKTIKRDFLLLRLLPTQLFYSSS